MLLAACGGGGGGVSTPGTNAPPVATPTPAPTPALPPTPTPTPPPTAADGAEYKASAAVVGARAAYAYDKGITGKGVTIAVIDTGIAVNGPEFMGRISPDSKAFENRIARCPTCAPETVTFALDDLQGHGTETASVALAAKNGTGVHGVAPDATLLALKISGPDLEGVTATSPIKESGAANAMNIAPAIRYSVDKGAFVLSLSLNGVSSGQAAAEQRAAMDQVAGADRLMVASVSNDIGDDSAAAGTIARNLVGDTLENRDWFLFGIRVDAALRPPTGNGRPGDLADRTLAVVATNVQVVGKDGSFVITTGNSFAAPAIAGAAALLKQYWPQLGGKAIARILLDTATDLGDKGVDQIYGAGLLDIEQAMKAQAPASAFAAADTVLARYSSLTLSGPFGNGGALAATTAAMTVFDRYGRDYRMTGSAAPRHRGSGLLAGAMLAPVDPPWLTPTQTDARLGFTSATTGPWQGARSNQPTTIAFSPAPGQSVTLAANIAIGQNAGISGSALRGVVATPVGQSFAWVSSGWSAGFASGIARDRRAALRTVWLTTPVGIGVELSDLAERGQVLGLRGATGFSLSGGRTTLATLTASRGIAGLLLSARATAATTRVEGGSDLLRFTGPLVGSAFAFDAARRLAGGTATLGLSSPLRLERARATVQAPVAYDLLSGALTTRTASIDLTPTARELDIELGWSTAFGPNQSLRLGIAHAVNAGHVAGVHDTAGFATLVLR
ncbi:S8 family serine peptidase [Sphingomonas sp. 2R-10]|uniref:S8 family serine peptidase n=1 Tax=Sphingomonas sp. 2R-10 TaxID=3045148 RepID=UPI0019D14E87|nr:S8 family serine peptidase [Sphingomonas sp. 2R-10]MDJ0276660.1 S8 family serine peptidase [Sphingomonas sp. 2R-10]